MHGEFFWHAIGLLIWLHSGLLFFCLIGAKTAFIYQFPELIPDPDKRILGLPNQSKSTWQWLQNVFLYQRVRLRLAIRLIPKDYPVSQETRRYANNSVLVSIVSVFSIPLWITLPYGLLFAESINDFLPSALSFYCAVTPRLMATMGIAWLLAGRWPKLNPAP